MKVLQVFQNEVRNTRVTKSGCEIKVRKMTSC